MFSFGIFHNLLPSIACKVFFLIIMKYKKYLNSNNNNCLLNKILDLKKYNDTIYSIFFSVCSVLVLIVLRKLFSNEKNKSSLRLSSNIHLNPKNYLSFTLFSLQICSIPAVINVKRKLSFK